MRNVDFSPLYRSFIGLDHLASMVDHASRQEKQPSYPPYNVELLAEDKYRITMAVAGFVQDELEIESQQNTLIVKGTKAPSEADKQENEKPRQFLYQGIAERNFERKFQLGDFVKVIDASMETACCTSTWSGKSPKHSSHVKSPSIKVASLSTANARQR